MLLLAGWELRIHSQKKPNFSVGTGNFRDGIAEAGHPFVGVQAGGGWAPASNPPGLKISAASSACQPLPPNEDLVYAVLEQALIAVTDLGPIHFARIGKHVGNLM